ncbi:winged helix-turn-helix transcriptional regulator [Rossellomorea aquimaris]|uniref:carbohydrate kinase n=1 Tax=Rossellomorea aquimaris TaxID=189382 RepID=UPI001CD4D5D8|nr:carbohydrate kinase [Rossellomorea aquimaris]MCA1055944.1 winged helix-turn-helix transcriptional regulator [Rossellomorea aquimaris]
MNEKEKLLLSLIEGNPFMSQQELSEMSGLSRSAVAGYISNLVKEGKILGRAYVLPGKKGVTCIGGANIDRKLQLQGEMLLETSNPAQTSQASGGVARNIAENLGRLGLNSCLLTVVGDDVEGNWIMDQTKNHVDVSASISLYQKTTGTYSAVLNNQGDLMFAIADMELYESVDIGFIEKKWGSIASSEMVVLDTNFSEEVLAYIIRRCQSEGIPLTIVPVSAPKIKKLPSSLEGVTWFICNKGEAEAYLDIKIDTEGDFFKAAKLITQKGAERVVITRGDQGLVYYTIFKEASAIVPPKVKVVDVTGAGDALVSGIIYGYIKGSDTDGACRIGVTCSSLTLQSAHTVSPSLTKCRLQQQFSRYY